MRDVKLLDIARDIEPVVQAAPRLPQSALMLLREQLDGFRAQIVTLPESEASFIRLRMEAIGRLLSE